MKVINTVRELREALAACDSNNVGFVPTMGALHAGHCSLVERARRENGTVVVSVFVNPTQFNDKNDLRNYPRTPEEDCRILERAGADIVFMPAVDEIYPEPDTRTFDFGKIDKVMEGATRPGHFNGVAQVVSRLFAMVEPRRAYFGEKDFQQIAVIRRMVELTGSPVEIVACPIKREADGLALSSRNVRLTAEQRAAAPQIHEVLAGSADLAREGITDVEALKEMVVTELNAIDGMEVEYYEIVDPTTLQPAEDISGAVGCVTVWMDDVRLIDNIKYPKAD